NRCGILIGSGMGGMSVFHEGTKNLVTKGFKRVTPFFVPYIITNMGGALLSIDLGFTGPNYSISTACATATYSIISAAEHIQRGDADLMIAGGSEAAINPVGVAGFVACKALSEWNDKMQQASRPWDKDRNGFVMGEGSGVLVLESLEHAQKRGAPILAEYLGGAVSSDAYHMTDPREDGSGVAECIDLAIADAGIQKDRINYINAHATSTPVGDLCEMRGIKKVFGDHAQKLAINSTKSMTGHCLGAAGGIESIATIKAMMTSNIHPTINLENPEEELNGLNLVTNQAQKLKITAGLSNSFGFGGHNSSIVFGPFEG
ncbi:MAG: beta-ketoacyl-ACP synthase II, partial [Simkaniaceae bacterium]|nr:beta-ketoacyl-ACP synthase II [Simkaniaceae bacterium]